MPGLRVRVTHTLGQCPFSSLLSPSWDSIANTFPLAVTNGGNDWCELPLQTTEEESLCVSLVPAAEIIVDAQLEQFSSEV